MILTAQSPREFVVARRLEGGANILVMGGGDLARSFPADDALDEIHLRIHPLLLGNGIALFPRGFPERAFRLAGNTRYEPNGILDLEYARLGRCEDGSRMAKEPGNG